MITKLLNQLTRRTDTDNPERGRKDGDCTAAATEMTPNTGARTGPCRSMDGNRTAAAELAQPARARQEWSAR
jgi:hypothetical protein